MTVRYIGSMSEQFEANRSRLFGIAYGMLGSVMDAEDVVQDAYLRWANVDQSTIDSPAAYLTTITTRLAIDRLRSARHRRETYVGAWLPEPLVTSPDPGSIVAEAEQLSLALLTTFERLNPVERAVLLLRDVFDFEYAEIAPIVTKSAANCRQIARRARDRVAEQPRARPQPEVEERIVFSYAAALVQGDVDGLIQLLAHDVMLWSDGGGKVRAARHPVMGADRVARFVVNVNRKAPPGLDVRRVRVNGSLGFAAFHDGAPWGVLAFDVADDQITAIRVILNPDKLRHLS